MRYSPPRIGGTVDTPRASDRRLKKESRGLTLLDAGLCANGIAAAIYEAEFFGGRLSLLHMLFFISLCVVGYCGVILLVALIADFAGHERKKLLLVVGTNLLPIVVLVLKHMGFLPFDLTPLHALFEAYL
jgi:hypothetical protein